MVIEKYMKEAKTCWSQYICTIKRTLGGGVTWVLRPLDSRLQGMNTKPWLKSQETQWQLHRFIWAHISSTEMDALIGTLIYDYELFYALLSSLPYEKNPRFEEKRRERRHKKQIKVCMHCIDKKSFFPLTPRANSW